MRDIRICHLTASLEIGGRERTVLDLCQIGRKDGVNCQIVTFDQSGTDDIFAHEGIRVARLDRTLPGFSVDLAATLARPDLDVVHAHGPVAAVYAASCRPAHLPLIVTLHASLGPDWKAALAIRSALRSADRLIAVSDQLARQVARFTRRRVSTIHTGVEIAKFDRPSANDLLDERPIVVGTAGRLHPVKGQKYLIAAVRMAAECGQALALNIAGEGAERPSLERLAKNLDVNFLGVVTDMPAFYGSLDLFCLPSRHEGCPLALIEAMASGLPCIATEVGGVTEILSGPQDGGVLVAKKHSRALAAAISRLASRPEQRQKIGQAARRRSLSFSLERQLASYDTLYRSVIT